MEKPGNPTERTIERLAGFELQFGDFGVVVGIAGGQSQVFKGEADERLEAEADNALPVFDQQGALLARCRQPVDAVGRVIRVGESTGIAIVLLKAFLYRISQPQFHYCGGQLPDHLRAQGLDIEVLFARYIDARIPLIVVAGKEGARRLFTVFQAEIARAVVLEIVPREQPVEVFRWLKAETQTGGPFIGIEIGIGFIDCAIEPLVGDRDAVRR